jgi:integrase
MINDILTNDEMRQFWRWFSDHWEEQPAFLVGLMFATGMRMREARAVRVDDCRIYAEPLFLTCHRAKRKADDTGPTTRAVDILPSFKGHYVAYVERCRALGKTWLFEPSRYNRNRPIQRVLAHYWWTQTLAAAGIAHRGSHCARRTFATYACRLPFEMPDGRIAYMQLGDLKDQLGHSSLDTTNRYYRNDVPGARFPGQAKIDWHQSIGHEGDKCQH